MTAMTARASPSGHEASYADIVERMFREFEDRLELKHILDVVNNCRHDVQGTPAGTMPELTERLARHRLAVLAAEASPAHPQSDAPAGAETPNSR
jgi:hypothetical protein